MKINGFQKMTLLDFPSKVACTIFTAGCNFRCPFCHNASLVTHINEDTAFSEEEILEYLSKRQGLLEGVCITGGEPLINADIGSFVAKIKALGFAVKVDTNGSFPERLKELIDSGNVDYVAMDIKNSKEKYALTAGTDNFSLENIEKSVGILKNSDIDYEFRTTIVDGFHTVEDIASIGEWIKGAKGYYLQNFVDSGDLIENGLESINSTELYKMQQIASQFVVKTEIRGI
ncbi:MAG: anaerobic ribonucleoside-triphosphate reductase activating protein [Ruminococcaceae bacterium]|nr:anaerobic ribonucleoside-triphosphate reductase activating protein [Oscillospiraceae bacterium]